MGETPNDIPGNNATPTSSSTLLQTSQSAISHAIKLIEKDLGVDLFFRGKAEIVLTEVGFEILAKAHSILGLFDSIKHTANETKNVQQGVLKVGFFGPFFLLGCCQLFYLDTVLVILILRCT